MNNNLSRSERILAEKTICILLVRGKGNDGSPVFAYVAVRADRIDEFMEAQKRGTFYPEDYGVIVESGIGEPEAEIISKMEKEYGFNHEMMIDIPDTAKAEQLTNDITKCSSKNME